MISQTVTAGLTTQMLDINAVSVHDYINDKMK